MKKDEYEKKVENMNHPALIEKSADEYSENKFWKKLKAAGRKMGGKLVYYSLVLFYAMQDDNVPKKAKLTIAGALGYLILPVDLIPDFIPVVGFMDDLALIIYALRQVFSHVSEETKKKAYEQTSHWFGEEPEEVKNEFMPKQG
jgi:uncharacterized membrane protein YkvA (DUF1232 family)